MLLWLHSFVYRLDLWERMCLSENWGKRGKREKKEKRGKIGHLVFLKVGKSKSKTSDIYRYGGRVGWEGGGDLAALEPGAAPC